MDFNIKNDLEISKPIIMNKNISKNSDYLMRLARRAKGDAPPKISKIIELYNLRKIAQIQTAENVIHKLISKDPKEQKKGFKQAAKIIDKYNVVEPLTHRLREKTALRNVIQSVEPWDAKKAKTEVIIKINQRDMIKIQKSEFGGPDLVIENHALFDYVYNSIKKRLHYEVEKVMKIKKTMKM